MQNFCYYFAQTQQWLNWSYERGLYRGQRSDESSWCITQVENDFILEHVKTGYLLSGIWYLEGVTPNSYKITVTDLDGSTKVIDANVSDKDDTDSVILWRQSDNPNNHNQDWQIIINIDNVKLYNSTSRTCLTISNRKYEFTPLDNIGNKPTSDPAVWAIKDNRLRHKLSGLEAKNMRLLYTSPLSFVIQTSANRYLSESNRSAEYTNALIWNFIPLTYKSPIQALVPVPVPPVPPIPQIPQFKSLSILTLNVQFYESASPDEIAAAILEFKRTVEDLDVICLQEDSHDEGISYLEGYTKIARCKAERPAGSYTDYYSNTIWVSNQLVYEESGSLTFASECSSNRCVSTVIVNGLKIANTHLCGGRYADINFRDYVNVKNHEIEQIVELYHPDIIVGDFNSARNPVIASKNLGKYPLYRDLSEGDQLTFFNYYRSVHDTLDQLGYIPAYDEKIVPRTTVYGGTVDWIYYLGHNQVAMVSDVITLPLISIPTKALTDHNGVYVRFRLI